VVGVIAIAVLLVSFVGATNVVLDEYATGALRTAVDDAAQAGAAAGGSLSACYAEGDQVRQELLPGPYGDGVRFACTLAPGEVVASASGYLPSFVPEVPRQEVVVQGLSLIDVAGGP